MKWSHLCALVLTACLLTACGRGDQQSLTVSVMGASGENPVQFEGEYTYLSGGREMTGTISGEGNQAEAFRGDKVIAAEVEMTGGEGWIRLSISEGMDQVFESERVDEVGGVIRYVAEHEQE